MKLTERAFIAAMDHVATVRPPDFVVGADSDGGPYLLRWYLTPWRAWQTETRRRAETDPTWWNRAVVAFGNLLPNVYLHQFMRDDDDRALHDHPWPWFSWLIRGRYIEHTIDAGGIHHHRARRQGDWKASLPHRAHRVELLPIVSEYGQEHWRHPAWTIFVTGPVLREWGFHCPERGWVHWKEFTAAGKPGEVGAGCDA